MTMTLNWVDYSILGIFLLSILSGFWRGLVRELISLLILAAAFIVATMFASTLAASFTQAPMVQGTLGQAAATVGMSASQPVSYVAIGFSFALLFAGTLLAGALLGYFLNMAFQMGILGIGNRFLGGIFGFVRAYIINVVLIFLVQLTPFSAETVWKDSKGVAFFTPSVQWLAGIVSPNVARIESKFGQYMK